VSAAHLIALRRAAAILAPMLVRLRLRQGSNLLYSLRCVVVTPLGGRAHHHRLKALLQTVKLRYVFLKHALADDERQVHLGKGHQVVEAQHPVVVLIRDPQAAGAVHCHASGVFIPLAVVAWALLVKSLWPSTRLAPWPLLKAATVDMRAANSASTSRMRPARV
jgi:hypothetical protein